MALSVTPVDAHDIDNIAEGLTGFLDENQVLQQSLMTTLFISGASEASNGRCSYLLLDDGSRMWVPNSLRCWIVDVQIKTQQYDSFKPVEKLLIRVTASDGTTYVYRCGFDSWTATSFLTQFKHLTRKQPAESAFTGEKLGYDGKLDIISYVNGTSQDNEGSTVIKAQVQVEEAPFEGPA